MLTNTSFIPIPPPLIQQPHIQANLDFAQVIFAAITEMTKFITMALRNPQILPSVNQMEKQARNLAPKIAFQVFRELHVE